MTSSMPLGHVSGMVRVWAAVAVVAVFAGACGGAPESPPGAAGAPATVPAGDGFVAGSPDGGGASRSCTTDRECDDANACTRDVCRASGGGEFASRACANEAIAGCVATPPAPSPAPAGNETGNGGADDAIDAACANGADDQLFLPFKPLVSPALAAGCNKGFEWQNCQSSMTHSLSGAVPAKLFVDLATYTASDRLRIVGVDANGQTYVLFDTCRVRTANYSDPTGGAHRPPDDSIRQFTLDVRPGTKSLTYDATQAGTPFYLRVSGLCGSLPAPQSSCDFRSI